MNSQHTALCPTPEWAEHMRTEVLPRLLGGVDLGRCVLEVGPGPGAVTEELRHKVAELTVVEIEDEAAELLRTRFAGTSVTVVTGDATAMTFADGSFDAAICCTMLHHVPTADLQNALLGQVLRVLRPGGVLTGSDSLPSDGLHHFHEGDVYNPVDPAGMYGRMQTLGFERITVSGDGLLTFRAYKPV